MSVLNMAVAPIGTGEGGGGGGVPPYIFSSEYI